MLPTDKEKFMEFVTWMRVLCEQDRGYIYGFMEALNFDDDYARMTEFRQGWDDGRASRLKQVEAQTKANWTEPNYPF